MCLFGENAEIKKNKKTFEYLVEKQDNLDRLENLHLFLSQLSSIHANNCTKNWVKVSIIILATSATDFTPQREVRGSWQQNRKKN